MKYEIRKIKNGGYLIVARDGETVTDTGAIVCNDVGLCVLNPSSCEKVEHGVYAFSLFQANLDLLMPVGNIVAAVGLNNEEGVDITDFETLDDVVHFIELNKIAPYQWKTRKDRGKYNFGNFAKFLQQPSIKIEDSKIASMVYLEAESE